MNKVPKYRIIIVKEYKFQEACAHRDRFSY